MGGIIMKCQELQIWDWITDGHGFPMQITNVGDDYAYATFEGNEGDPWEFDDKDEQPHPILLTPEILEKNGWERTGIFFTEKKIDENTHLSWSDIYGSVLYQNDYYMCDCKYVHNLQHALRLCGFNELANNFKV